ncbi:MAG: SPOR domain-containing protein, partial [Candidatus Binatia bacterium]
ITRNPKTAPLQFANNISSVGGIGFFTHSAAKSPDERFLEVVLGTPETFEVKGEFSDKVQRLFARYGLELLGIVSGDNDIFQDREMSGYGLNFAWRNVVSEPTGNRVALERAIIYFSKERVRNFLRQELSQNDLLGDAVIFAIEEDGPLNLVSLHPKEPKPDVRPTIQEDNLAALSSTSRAPGAAPNAAEPAKSVRLGVAEPVALNPRTESRAPVILPAEAKTMKAQEALALPEQSVNAAEVSPAKAAVSRPAPKQLEGFIVQLAFSDKAKAQRWAESMEKRGYAVSLTEAGAEGALRVRLGNFTGRDEAERQLKTFKQDGLSGIVISLPQAFRPDARTSIP